MEDKPTRKKSAAKTPRTAAKTPAKKKQTDTKEKTPYISDATREQLSKLGDKLGEATDKGVHVARDVAEKVRHFAIEATELTKLKIEIHKFKSSRDKLICEMGSKVWALYESKTLSDIQEVLIGDFQEMERLRAAIANKEVEIGKIKL